MIDSVITNNGAQVALQSLNVTTTQLQAAQKQVSTGLRVADAIDDGAAFTVSQNVRADVGALAAADGALGNAKGLMATTVSALTSLSNSLAVAKSLLVQIADPSISQDSRDQYDASFERVVQQVANTVDGSTYSGRTVLGAAAGALAGKGTKVASNEDGGTLTLSSEDCSALPNELAALIGSTFARTEAGVDTFGTIADGDDQFYASTALSSPFGVQSFALVQGGLSNQLNEAGAQSRLLDTTITANQAKIDSLNAGLGALIDADLGKESATLQALQIRQQLGNQALSLANQAPQALLSLFKG